MIIVWVCTWRLLTHILPSSVFRLLLRRQGRERCVLWRAYFEPVVCGHLLTSVDCMQFDPIDREGLEAPLSAPNKDGVYQCKKHSSTSTHIPFLLTYFDAHQLISQPATSVSAGRSRSLVRALPPRRPERRPDRMRATLTELFHVCWYIHYMSTQARNVNPQRHLYHTVYISTVTTDVLRH